MEVVQQNPMHIHLIIESLMAQLDTKSLLAAQRTCRTWQHYASREFCKRARRSTKDKEKLIMDQVNVFLRGRDLKMSRLVAKSWNKNAQEEMKVKIVLKMNPSQVTRPILNSTTRLKNFHNLKLTPNPDMNSALTWRLFLPLLMKNHGLTLTSFTIEFGQNNYLHETLSMNDLQFCLKNFRDLKSLRLLNVRCDFCHQGLIYPGQKKVELQFAKIEISFKEISCTTHSTASNLFYQQLLQCSRFIDDIQIKDPRTVHGGKLFLGAIIKMKPERLRTLILLLKVPRKLAIDLSNCGVPFEKVLIEDVYSFRIHFDNTLGFRNVRLMGDRNKYFESVRGVDMEEHLNKILTARSNMESCDLHLKSFLEGYSARLETARQALRY